MVVLCLTIIGLFAGCSKQPTKDYGVFLNVREGLDDLSDYHNSLDEGFHLFHLAKNDCSLEKNIESSRLTIYILICYLP